MFDKIGWIRSNIWLIHRFVLCLQKKDGAEEISKLNWVRHTKQGVYFVKSPTKINDLTLANENTSCMSYDVSFEPSTGEIDFNFQLQTS